jgi:hypothetical protein
MNWQRLLDEGRAEPHRTSRAELDGLRAVADRNLRDAASSGISADTRFGCAYEAALALATIAVAYSGYRIKGPGHHRTTFEALPIALPGRESREDARYFDRCRQLRNVLSYESADVVSERDVSRLLVRVEAFRRRIEQFVGPQIG